MILMSDEPTTPELCEKCQWDKGVFMAAAHSAVTAMKPFVICGHRYISHNDASPAREALTAGKEARP
jgi:hypothetical protein